MIAVRLEGRLGNQLFQYAFAFAAAQKLRTGFYLDKSIEPFIPAKYFNVKKDFAYPLDKSVFAVKGFKNIFCYRLKQAFYSMLQNMFLSKQIITINGNQSPQQALLQVKKKHMYHGFFQSELYFENAKAELKQQLTLKKSFINQYNYVADKLSSPQQKIVIHIRRGDYLDHNLSLPLSYYKTALTEAGYQDKFCVFISDDPDYISKEFAYIKSKYISTHTEIIDFQFLMHADICILSNSSFSWWGAWLNTKKEKVIYCPKYYMGYHLKKDYPLNIYPDDWKKIAY